MREDTFKDMCLCGETTKVQFKPEFTSQKEFAKEMIAFANTKGRSILFGVEDKTSKLIGLTNNQFIASTAMPMADKAVIQQKMVDKWSISPTLAGKLADIVVFLADKAEIKTETLVNKLGFAETTAKRHLRQLTEMGYLKAHGGNRNRTYTIESKLKEIVQY